MATVIEISQVSPHPSNALQRCCTTCVEQVLEHVARVLQLELVVVGPDHQARILVERDGECFSTAAKVAALSRRLGPTARSAGVAVAHAESTMVDGAEICAFPALDGLVMVASGPAHPRAPSIEGLRRLYGLTRTEAWVARALSVSNESHSPASIAEELGVELSTIRTHLRSIQSKLGAESQTDLVRRLLSSAAVMLTR
ncbi:MAG TPA: LuxR C-terminal-related transcriptional regulator [Myxococcota bacterium]|nr:LuxR C-terminal-related transcriptional regulator [Myxococcota bacterium]